ncbi:MAG TPA: L,D-transpeptidase family protein [Polyangia bacterium]|jgi:murein L,D-transpeptidase YafK|nr:L,D-transpeptidase family protein [Polyangia bacterium]
MSSRSRSLPLPAVIVVIVGMFISCRAHAQPGPCHPHETAVVVETRARRLHLCEAGQVARSFDVALGVGGVGKQRQGDNKTPLGEYGLGPPRASHDYHLFVPVGYPTVAQARQGFTGSAIGIHGPPRGFAGLLARAGTVVPNWTAGCIALPSDDEIEAVAAWLRRQTTRRVRVEGAL